MGFIFRFNALVPLKFLRVQNLMASSPKGMPSVVSARLECISKPRIRYARFDGKGSAVIKPIDLPDA